MSASVVAPTTLKSNSPVPLDTIPISPEKENTDPNMSSEGASASNGSGSNGSAKSGDEPITVFHDPENFNVKHPLMHEWTLWFTKPPSGKVTQIILESMDFALMLTCKRAIIGMIFSRKSSRLTRWRNSGVSMWVYALVSTFFSRSISTNLCSCLHRTISPLPLSLR